MADLADNKSQTNICPLPWKDQRRNLILFATCTGLQYFAAPVLYVGMTQASLCDRLNASVSTANLPGTLFFAMTAMPALIAWLSPRAASLKRNLSCCYACSGLMLAAIALTLALPTSDNLRIAMVVLQGAVTGAVMPAAIALLWEAAGRGVGESHRGLMLSLGFGLGPVLAVLGSFLQMTLLGGDLFGFHFAGIEYPMKFVVLFGIGAPIMGLEAILGQFLVIPPVEFEPPRASAKSVIGLLIGLPAMFASVGLVQAAALMNWNLPRVGGIAAACVAALAFVYHFRAIFSQPVLLTATMVTILVYTGNVIPSNMTLYSEQVLGGRSEDYVGMQNMLRFGFKVVAGVVLGWVLTRANPRAGVLLTSSIYLMGQVWALFVTGSWYLVAFGLHGAGELVGVYAPNYIVSASKRDELRRNTAFMTMLMVPAAPAGFLFGAIVDSVKSAGWTAWGISSQALGFRISFVVCGLLILCGIVLAALRLPANPRPADDSRAMGD